MTTPAYRSIATGIWVRDALEINVPAPNRSLTHAPTYPSTALTWDVIFPHFPYLTSPLIEPDAILRMAIAHLVIEPNYAVKEPGFAQNHP
jgi:hypothetical protein